MSEQEHKSELSQYFKSTPAMVHRSKINKAPYNPRKLTEKARAKLKENIKRVGLLGGIIWNKRTGNLVGGHQRLGILDSLEGTQDYKVRVEMVDLSERDEREQNIFLNNQEAQGEWDLEALDKMFAEQSEELKIDFDATGFTQSNIYQLFGSSPTVEQDAQTMLDLSEKVRQSKELTKAIREQNSAKDPKEYYFVIFASDEEKNQARELLGLPFGKRVEQDRYIDGKHLLTILRRALQLDPNWKQTAADTA